jgi:hypothetical protein
MTDIINTDASPGDTFYDMSEVREAMGDPRYRTSARYRDEVAAKLHRSQQAGTVVSQTSYHGSQKRTLGRDRDYDFGHPNANANANGFIQPGADQAWAEAAKVGQAGSIFKSPEEIMWAMSAPHFEADAAYQQAVREKIDRSIREGWITRDFQTAKPSQ